MFKPRKNQHYFMINSRFEVKDTQNTGSKKAKDRIAVGNCFKTKQEATEFANKVLRLAGKQTIPPIKMTGKFAAPLNPLPWWRFW